MAKIKEQLDMFKGSDAAYEDALENMKKTRKLAAERTKEVDKAAEDIVKATATEEVRLQGTKEPKVAKTPYTERLDVKNRKELAKLVESAKKEGKRFRVTRSLKEGFRYTLMLDSKLEEARGKGKGQKLDKYFKLVNRLHKDKLTDAEVAEIRKAIDEVKLFEPAGDWEVKDKKNLLDQLAMVLEVVDTPIKSKSLKEDNALNKSKYKALIGKHFDHSFDFEFLDVVANTLNRLDFPLENEEEDVFSAIDDALIYNADRWTIAKHYVSNPADLNWDDVISEFGDDIEELARKINKGDIDESLTENRTVKEVSHSIDDNGTLSIYVDGRVLSTISDCGEMSQEEISSLINDELADKDIIVESLTEEVWKAFKVNVIHTDIPDEDNPWETFTVKAKSREDAEKLIEDATIYVEEDIPGAFYTLVIESGGRTLHKISQLTGEGVDDFDYLISDLLRLVVEDEVSEALTESKLKEELKVVVRFDAYKPWSGAERYYNLIADAGKLDDLEQLLEELYPDSVTDTDINDLLWFEGDWVLQQLGVRDDLDEPDLPSEITTTAEEIGRDLEDIRDDDDIVSDWLSDEYGFTHYGFNYHINEYDEVVITDIDWDTSESFIRHADRDKLFEVFIKEGVIGSEEAQALKESTSYVTAPEKLVAELLDELIYQGAELNNVIPILKEHGLDVDNIIAQGVHTLADEGVEAFQGVEEVPNELVDDELVDETDADGEDNYNFEWVDDEYGWDFEENLVPMDEDENPLSHKNLKKMWDEYQDEGKMLDELEKLDLDITFSDLQGIVGAFILMLDDGDKPFPYKEDVAPSREELTENLKEQKGRYSIIASTTGLQERVVKRTETLEEAFNFVKAVEDKYLYALVVDGDTKTVVSEFDNTYEVIADE